MTPTQPNDSYICLKYFSRTIKLNFAGVVRTTSSGNSKQHDDSKLLKRVFQARLKNQIIVCKGWTSVFWLPNVLENKLSPFHCPAFLITRKRRVGGKCRYCFPLRGWRETLYKADCHLLIAFGFCAFCVIRCLLEIYRWALLL